MPAKKIKIIEKQKYSKVFRASPMKLNLKGTRQFPPPTSNPWNGLRVDYRHTNLRMNHQNKQSSPRLDRLFSSSASTGGSTDYIEKRGCLFVFRLEKNSPRLNSRSIEDKTKTQTAANPIFSDVPWKRKNKFLVVVPWIYPMSNPWHFPRSPVPNRMESVWILWKTKNFSGRRNGQAPI